MNPYKDQVNEAKLNDLMERCRALLKNGDKVAAVKLYRAEMRCSLPVAMKALADK